MKNTGMSPFRFFHLLAPLSTNKRKFSFAKLTTIRDFHATREMTLNKYCGDLWCFSLHKTLMFRVSLQYCHSCKSLSVQRKNSAEKQFFAWKFHGGLLSSAKTWSIKNDVSKKRLEKFRYHHMHPLYYHIN